MTAKRNGDTLRITLKGAEIAEYMDLTETVMDQLEPDERLTYYTIRNSCEVVLVIDLEIEAAPGQSEAEIYRRENGVPLV